MTCFSARHSPQRSQVLLLGQWVSHTLFERRDGRKDQQLNLDDLAQEWKHKRYKEIRE